MLLDRPTSHVNARVMLSLMLLAGACLFTDLVVALRPLTIGTDTNVYATFFLALRDSLLPSRFEPGFVLFTRALSATGMSVAAYQGWLFAVILATAVVASRKYFDYLGDDRNFLTFLAASLAFLFLSPTFVNGSINAVRQGAASLLVFTALLAFYRRQWRSYVLYGLLATSFHYSSVLYLAAAPALLLSERTLRVVAVLAFLAYCTGLTQILVKVGVPPLYDAVANYLPNAEYKGGVRIDFAVFSIFWYGLPYALSWLIREPYAERIKHSTAVYLTLLLPFFLIGWGNYSNRYLLPAWMASSLFVGAIFFHSRFSPMRNPLILRGLLVVSCLVFAFYVQHEIVL